MGEELRFCELDDEQGESLFRATGGMYPQGFVRFTPSDCIMPRQFAPLAKRVRSMDVRQNDVWLVTFPKCGTTWTQEMVWLLSNNLNFAAAKQTSLHDRFPFLEVSSLSSLFNKIVVGEEMMTDSSLNQVQSLASPRFIKTHLPRELLPLQLWTVKPKIIYVAREVKDVMVSYYHHNRLMVGYQNTLAQFCQSFMQHEIMYTPFWSHILEFWKMRDQENILFFTYENMQKDLKAVIRKTSKFLGVEVTPENVVQLSDHLSFKKMKENTSVNYSEMVERLKEKNVSTDKDGQFMREGKSGNWKTQISIDIAAQIDQWTAYQLKNTDYVNLS